MEEFKNKKHIVFSKKVFFFQKVFFKRRLFLFWMIFSKCFFRGFLINKVFLLTVRFSFKSGFWKRVFFFLRKWFSFHSFLDGCLFQCVFSKVFGFSFFFLKGFFADFFWEVFFFKGVFFSLGFFFFHKFVFFSFFQFQSFLICFLRYFFSFFCSFVFLDVFFVVFHMVFSFQRFLVQGSLHNPMFCMRGFFFGGGEGFSIFCKFFFFKGFCLREENVFFKGVLVLFFMSTEFCFLLSKSFFSKRFFFFSEGVHVFVF